MLNSIKKKNFHIVDIYLSSVLQGITEFLPVSSSFHLFIFKHFNNFDLRSLELFLHCATLLSIILFFREKIFTIAKNFLFKKEKIEGFVLIIATLPALFIGFFVKKIGITAGLKIMAISSIVFGIILGISDFVPQKKTSVKLKDGFLIGISQTFAFIPGASRLGCTLAMARFCKIEQKESICFSFLLSIPTLFGAIVLNAKEFVFDSSYAIAFLLTFLVGYLFLSLLMQYASVLKLWAFGLYRVILGAVVLLFLK